jgi:hypothetical protein
MAQNYESETLSPSNVFILTFFLTIDEIEIMKYYNFKGR